MILEAKNEDEMIRIGQKLGAILNGGEVIELIGDVGSGKTTLVKGIAIGLDISDIIHSPSFSINCTYDARNGLTLSHYDFYRLNNPGIMTDELCETLNDKGTITVIEWSEIIQGVLPADRLSINIVAQNEDSRRLELSAGGRISKGLLGKL
jgi:tRNA threonylcarbamoyladenosine biosynthesis protein TsaE